jgi:CRP-like cAMP-binding protein
MLTRVAGELSQLKPDRTPNTVPLGGLQYRTSIPLRSPADDLAARSTFLRWIWYAARREGLHLDEAEDEFSTPELVADAMRKVVAPALRLTAADQEGLAEHATVVKYGADEIVQHLGEVPTRMTFIVSGRIRVVAPTGDGSVVPVTTLREGSFLGQTALTREAVLAEARAAVEVTALRIGREHIEEVLQQKPLLLQELGRLIEERRGHVRRVVETVDE